MEEYKVKRMVWGIQRRQARRAFLKFFIIFVALCVTLDVWGTAQIILMALFGIFVLWLFVRYLRVRNESVDGDMEQLIYFDMFGRMRTIPYSEIGSYRKKRTCIVIRDRKGHKFCKIRKQICRPDEMEMQLREACPALKLEGSV